MFLIAYSSYIQQSYTNPTSTSFQCIRDISFRCTVYRIIFLSSVATNPQASINCKTIAVHPSPCPPSPSILLQMIKFHSLFVTEYIYLSIYIDIDIYRYIDIYSIVAGPLMGQNLVVWSRR